MGSVKSEISKLEKQLRLAELGPDPKFFEKVLDDKVLIVAENGEPFPAKRRVVGAHQPGKSPKFTDVQMSDMKIIDHGTAAVVTCRGTYKTDKGTVALKFVRLWVKKKKGWKIVAGSISK